MRVGFGSGFYSWKEGGGLEVGVELGERKLFKALGFEMIFRRWGFEWMSLMDWLMC